MLGATRITAVLGAVPEGFNRTTHEQFKAFLSKCTNFGFHLFYIEPGTKVPIDYRTESQVNADTKAWNDQGFDGVPRGFNMATNDATRLISYDKRRIDDIRASMASQESQEYQRSGVGRFSAEYQDALNSHIMLFDNTMTKRKGTGRAEMEKKRADAMSVPHRALSNQNSPLSVEVRQQGAAQIQNELDAADKIYKKVCGLTSKTVESKIGKGTATNRRNEGTDRANEDARFKGLDIDAFQDHLTSVRVLVDQLHQVPGALEDEAYTAFTELWDSYFDDVTERVRNTMQSYTALVAASDSSGPTSPAALEISDRFTMMAETTPRSLAMVPGRSRIAVVDVDTPEEVAAFRKYWFDATGDPDAWIASPTVVTPGLQKDGEWKHSGGGHFYMNFPEGFELPEDAPNKITKKMVIDDEGNTGSFTIMLDGCYVLIPPSERPEGFYRVVSGDIPWMKWVEDLIVEEAEDQRNKRVRAEERRANKSNPLAPLPPISHPVYDDPVTNYVSYDQEVDIAQYIDQWASQTNWDDLLLEHGWHQTNMHDSDCGCALWTAPGIHGSPRSATAHDIGCTRGTDSGGNLHIWTDHPGPPLDDEVNDGQKNFSKLQIDAIYNHEGNVAAAMRSHNIPIRGNRDAEIAERSMELQRLLYSDISPDVEESRGPKLRPFREVRDTKPPEYLVDQTLEMNGILAVNGGSGVGKSFVVLDLACSLVTGTPWLGKATRKVNVAYAAGEGFSGAVTRIRAWEEARREATGINYMEELNNNLFLSDDAFNLPMMAADQREFRRVVDMVRESQAQLLILDTWARSIPGLDENSAEEVGLMVKMLDAVRRQTGCAICVIHHTAKHDPSTGRGSNALKGATDSELLISPHDIEEGAEYPGKPIEISVTKQKNVAEWDEAVIACVTPLDSEDPLLADIEVPPGFMTNAVSPGWGVITDTEGVVSGAALAANNWSAQEGKRPDRFVDKEFPKRDIAKAVYDMVHSRGTIGALKSEVQSAVGAELWNTDNITKKAKEAVTVVLAQCVECRLVEREGSNYHKPHRSLTPDQVSDLISKNFS